MTRGAEWPQEELGGQLDLEGRADLYSLGVCLHHCLTGTLPHPGLSRKVNETFSTCRTPAAFRDAVRTIARMLETPASPPSAQVPGAGIPPELDRLTLDLLAFRREDRVPGAQQARSRFEEVAQILERPPQRPAAPESPRSSAMDRVMPQPPDPRRREEPARIPERPPPLPAEPERPRSSVMDAGVPPLPIPRRQEEPAHAVRPLDSVDRIFDAGSILGPSSGTPMSMELSRTLQESPPSRRRGPLLAAAAFGAGILVLRVWWLLPTPRPQPDGSAVVSGDAGPGHPEGKPPEGATAASGKTREPGSAGANGVRGGAGEESPSPLAGGRGGARAAGEARPGAAAEAPHGSAQGAPSGKEPARGQRHPQGPLPATGNRVSIASPKPKYGRDRSGQVVSAAPEADPVKQKPQQEDLLDKLIDEALEKKGGKASAPPPPAPAEAVPKREVSLDDLEK